MREPKGDLWPDLCSSIDVWAGKGDLSLGTVPSSAESDAATKKSPRILEVPACQSVPPAAAEYVQPEGSGEPARDLGEDFHPKPDIFAYAEDATCRPRADERVLDSGQFQESAQESFRVLCQRLVQIRQERRLRTILVTSPLPHEGKTVTAINLAAMLARSASKVLLVDADLRHPRPATLGLDPRPGLADYLAGQIDLAHAIRRVTPLGFYYLSAGIATTNPAELLQKPALQEFVSQSAVFDWVIIDTSSINYFADPRYLAMAVDGVLLVVRQNVALKKSVEQSLAALDKAFVCGIVFNASTGPSLADRDRADKRNLTQEQRRAAATK